MVPDSKGDRVSGYLHLDNVELRSVPGPTLMVAPIYNYYLPIDGLAVM